MYSKTFNELYESLRAGVRYGRKIENVRFPYFHDCLYYYISENDGKAYFKYHDFGSFAVKATKRELDWLLKVIFKQTPEEFVSDHENELFVGMVYPLNDDGHKQEYAEFGLYILNDHILVDTELNIIAELDTEDCNSVENIISEINTIYSCSGDCDYWISYSIHFNNEFFSTRNGASA